MRPNLRHARFFLSDALDFSTSRRVARSGQRRRGIARRTRQRRRREGSRRNGAAADLQIIRAHRDLRVTLRARPLSILARFFTSLLFYSVVFVHHGWILRVRVQLRRVSPRYRETHRETERESAGEPRERPGERTEDSIPRDKIGESRSGTRIRFRSSNRASIRRNGRTKRVDRQTSSRA